MGLGLEIQKTNIGVRISIHVCQFSGKTDNLDFFDPNLPKNGFWGRNFKNLSPGSELPLPGYHLCRFSVKTDNGNFTCDILVFITLKVLQRAGWKLK